MTTQSPKVKAIVSIRNLVLGLSTEWKELKSLGAEIDVLVEAELSNVAKDPSFLRD